MSDSSNLRNFAIIAHIDHGKSTLADRLLETTGTVEQRKLKDRTLDTLSLEQERGITIKLQTARMNYEHGGKEYHLNLIDTPGHVDFSYEVSRSVAACEGALLIIDASQGVQAQTLSVLYKALEYDLEIIPVLNKVDLPSADVDSAKLELMEMFSFKENEIILASGKTGQGVDEILEAIVERIPSPQESESKLAAKEEEAKLPNPYTDDDTKMLIFDSFFHDYKGVVALVKIVKGNIQAGKEIYLHGSDTSLKPVEIGYLNPGMHSRENIYTGEVGYIATGLKDIKKVQVGDTIFKRSEVKNKEDLVPLPGYKPAKPMVYASLYPVEASDFEDFQQAVEKLALNDSAFTYQRETSQALGTGFICGFLGLLHLEIIQARLDREFGIDLISTVPTVEFKVNLTTTDYAKLPNFTASQLEENGSLKVRMAAEFPDRSLISNVLEPWVDIEIFTPEDYIGEIMELCQEKRGIYQDMHFTSQSESLQIKHSILKYQMPLVEIMVNFFDRLKSLSHGYASMDYTIKGYYEGDIVKVSILINEEEAGALSFLAHRSQAEKRGRELVEKLKEVIPQQQFKIPIQAAISSNIIAREDIAPLRKDVTAKLYGGDETRKKKLLEKQKKGKKKMKAIGKVELPKEVFLSALHSN